MNKRNILMGSAIMLAVLLVAGGTMAWFTADAEEVTNSFKAGRMEIEIEEEFDGDAAQNINPGDNFEKQVKVKNLGTKRAYIRVKLTPEFGEAGSSLDMSVVTYPVLPDWFLQSDGWYYYKNIVGPNASTTNLIEEVVFAGAEMTNAYQGLEFSLTVNAEAIQATNGAINDEWGLDPASFGMEVLP